MKGSINLAKLLTTVLALILGSFALVNVAINIQVILSPANRANESLTLFQAFATALSAAKKIFRTINRVSPLDPASEDGLKIEDVKGSIELRNVKHAYPSRPDICVINDLSLVFPVGTTTALVGASGSGKSTIVGLLERFYLPLRGQILIDGHDIESLNLKWMRQQMALVSQEVNVSSISFRVITYLVKVLLIYRFKST